MDREPNSAKLNLIDCNFSLEIPPIGVGDVVTLTKPYKTYFRGAELSLSSGRVEEVLGGGTLIAVRFAEYPNVCDFGVSRIASVMSLPRQRADVGSCTAKSYGSGDPAPSPQ